MKKRSKFGKKYKLLWKKVWAKVQIALEKAHTDFSSEISMLHVVSLQYMILIYENKPLKAFQYV